MLHRIGLTALWFVLTFVMRSTVFQVRCFHDSLHIQESRRSVGGPDDLCSLFSRQSILPHIQVSQHTLWKNRCWLCVSNFQSTQHLLHLFLTVSMIFLEGTSGWCLRLLRTTSTQRRWRLWSHWVCCSMSRHGRWPGFALRLLTGRSRLFCKRIKDLWLTRRGSFCFGLRIMFLRIYVSVSFFKAAWLIIRWRRSWWLAMFSLAFLPSCISFLCYQSLNPVKLCSEPRWKGSRTFIWSALEHEEELFDCIMQFSFWQIFVMVIQGSDDLQPSIGLSKWPNAQMFCCSPSFAREPGQETWPS